MPHRRPITAARCGVVVALAAALALSVASCSSGAGSSGRVTVVASTDVYGSIAAQIVGSVSGVTITSVITSPSQDPHTFEPGARTELTLSRARIVIENGGGYDDFMNRMLSASGNHHATVLNAVTLSGFPDTADLNEHVWYDFPTVIRVANRLVAALSTADPAGRVAFHRNGGAFVSAVDALMATERQIKSAHAGEPVAITEPVPLYMLQACGLINETPHAFSEAIENGTDVSPRVLQQVLTLFTDQKVRLLAYNEQAIGPQTQVVLAAAKAHHVPVVPVTETLPSGTQYLSWMRANLAAVAKALS